MFWASHLFGTFGFPLFFGGDPPIFMGCLRVFFGIQKTSRRLEEAKGDLTRLIQLEPGNREEGLVRELRLFFFLLCFPVFFSFPARFFFFLRRKASSEFFLFEAKGVLKFGVVSKANPKRRDAPFCGAHRYVDA